MNIQIQKNPKGDLVHLLTDLTQLAQTDLLKEEVEQFENGVKNKIYQQVFFSQPQTRMVGICALHRR